MQSAHVVFALGLACCAFALKEAWQFRAQMMWWAATRPHAWGELRAEAGRDGSGVVRELVAELQGATRPVEFRSLFNELTLEVNRRLAARPVADLYWRVCVFASGAACMLLGLWGWIWLSCLIAANGLLASVLVRRWVTTAEARRRAAKASWRAFLSRLGDPTQHA